MTEPSGAMLQQPERVSESHFKRTPIKVKTTKGVLVGFETSGVKSFRGIPFAKPPIGDLRFKNPVDIDAWEGEKQCVENGAACPQSELRIEMLFWPKIKQALFFGKEFLVGYGWNDNVEKPKPLPTSKEANPMSEDCLFLNVFAPASADAQSKLPVMVFIHGGAFVQGNGGAILFSHAWGSRFAKRENVVLVCINYRLGVLGFSTVEGGDTNCGIKDQVFALKWVKREIEAFGGDANNVTIFGESAGAMSCGTLLAVPEAAGLFHKAILESGGPVCVLTKEEAKTTTETLQNILKLKDNTIDTWKTVDAAKIRAAQSAAIRQHFRDIGLMPFQPVVDGDFLPQHPQLALAEKIAKKEPLVPLIVGYNAGEYSFFRKLAPMSTPKTYERLLVRVASAIGDQPHKLMLVDAAADGDSTPLKERANAAGEELLALLYIDEMKLRDNSQTITLDDAKKALRSLPKEVTDAMLDQWASYNVFGGPALNLAQLWESGGGKAFVYSFDYQSKFFNNQAAHALELPFVFGTYDLPMLDQFCGNAVDVLRPISHKVMKAWANFARNSNPNNVEEDEKQETSKDTATPVSSSPSSSSGLFNWIFSSAPNTDEKDVEDGQTYSAPVVKDWLSFESGNVMHIDKAAWQLKNKAEPSALYRVQQLRRSSLFSWGGPPDLEAKQAWADIKK